jgi:hypothetical protein
LKGLGWFLSDNAILSDFFILSRIPSSFFEGRMMMGQEQKYPEVPVQKLRRRCPPESLPFDSTDDIQPCTEIIGQERVLKAIHLSLEMDSLGYNG